MSVQGPTTLKSIINAVQSRYAVAIAEAVVLLSICTPASAGELTINNLSNATVDVAIRDRVVGADKKQGSGWYKYAINDHRKITFNGPDVWLRILKGGREVTFTNRTMKQSFVTARSSYAIYSTEAPEVLTLKWRKPGETRYTVVNWKQKTTPPNGWTFEDFFLAKDGDSFVLKPRGSCFFPCCVMLISGTQRSHNDGSGRSRRKCLSLKPTIRSRPLPFD